MAGRAVDGDGLRAVMVRPNPVRGRPLHHRDHDRVFSVLEDLDVPMVGNGYNYEADEIARCLAAGKTESDVLPLSETLSIMKTMDAIRAQWGLKYPME